MLKRMICLALMAALAASSMSVLAEGMSAAEALFGDGNYDDVILEVQSAPEVAEAGATGATGAAGATDEDMYGANDTASASVYPTLRLGDRDGEDGVAYVVFLQNRLIELGYLEDDADGTYGANTETAVKEFQKSNNLQITGIADPSTQEVMYSDINNLVRASADTTLYGSDCMRVQNALSLWGFMSTRVDGKMGDNTRAAIKKFKEYMAVVDPTYGVTPTPAPTATPKAQYSEYGDMPIVEDILLEPVSPVLYTADGEIDDPLLQYVDGVKDFRIFRQEVRNGDNGPEVLRVQTRLKSLKYLYSADGSFGNLTENALLYFQFKNGLNQTGIADQATQQRLFSTSATEAEEYVFPYKIIVDISDQRVYVGKWNGTTYKDLVKKMKCSTGKDRTPTPTGTYQSQGRAGGEWYYFKDFSCYAKWATRIVGGILFHSITYNRYKRPSGSVSGLGRKASHGCIRLSIDDAKWIYDNCPTGTTVVIQE